MSKDIHNPVLQGILNRYGIKVASTRKTALEAQDGVDSELRNDCGGKSVDSWDGIFSDNSFEMNEDVPEEGGNPIQDGEIPDATTPSGEAPTFDNAMLGDSGWGTESETTKKIKDPGYQGASPTSELSISGSSEGYGKTAAFMQKLQKFAQTQQQFVTKIAVISKIAEGLAGDMPPEEAGMDPMAAMAGMGGDGIGGEDPAFMEGGDGLDPETAAIIQAIVEAQGSEEPLGPEELAQIEAILGAGGDEGGMEAAMMEGAGLPGEDPMMGGGDPMMGGGDPMMEEPMLSPDEGKIAEALFDYDILKEADDDGGSDNSGESKSKSKKKDKGSDSKPSASETDTAEDAAEADLGGAEMTLTPDAGGCPPCDPSCPPSCGGGGGGGGSLLEIISQCTPEELQALCLLAASGGGGGAVAAEPDAFDVLPEPEPAPEEMSEMMALAQAASPEEYKEAAYYGMDIPSYRIAKDSLEKKAAKHAKKAAKAEQTLKEAMLQAKNAEQKKKAERYGQTIDSLIRK